MDSSDERTFRPMPKMKNIVELLNERSRGCSTCKHQAYVVRHFYKYTTPNFVIEQVKTPSVVIRRFSPDARYLVAFDARMNSVLVYRFKGSTAIASELSLYNAACVDSSLLSNNEDYVFDKFFEPHWNFSSNLVALQYFYQDFHLFVENGNCLIVASENLRSNTLRSIQFHFNIPPNQRYRNNESLEPNTVIRLDWYTFYLLDIDQKTVLDELDFQADKMILNGSHCASLIGNLFCLVSLVNQTIHIYRLIGAPTIKFFPFNSIGRFCLSTDSFLLSPLSGHKYGRDLSQGHALQDHTINCLKHRILTFLYKRALKTGIASLNHFYSQFDFILDLRMLKAQLVPDDRLLIKYTTEECIHRLLFNISNNIRTRTDPEPSLFVLFNLNSGEVESVFSDSQSILARAYIDYQEYFLAPHMAMPVGAINFNSFSSNNAEDRHTAQKQFEGLHKARPGGLVGANQRFVAHLPLNSQCTHDSPFVDPRLFLFDEKYITLFDKTRLLQSSSEMPVKYYDRETNRLLFKLNFLNRRLFFASNNKNKFLQLVYHPVEPFLISIVSLNGVETCVNFHMRKTNVD